MDFEGAIVDLDGTVYRGDSLVDGAPAAIDRLREAGISPLFFSNNPTKGGQTYVEHLTDLGIDARPGEALSAGDVTTEFLRENHTDDGIFLVGSDGLGRQLTGADLRLVEDPTVADVLLGSWTRSFDYWDMDAALQAVGEGTTFLGTDPDRTFPRANGDVEPGSGAIIDSLAATVGRDPDAILGKPSEHALERALDRLGADPTSCLVVGDRPSTDLRMGARAGMTTVLVLSGVTDRSDLPADVDPDYVLDSLADIDDVLADGRR